MQNPSRLFRLLCQASIACGGWSKDWSNHIGIEHKIDVDTATPNLYGRNMEQKQVSHPVQIHQHETVAHHTENQCIVAGMEGIHENFELPVASDRQPSSLAASAQGMQHNSPLATTSFANNTDCLVQANQMFRAGVFTGVCVAGVTMLVAVILVLGLRAFAQWCSRIVKKLKESCHPIAAEDDSSSKVEFAFRMRNDGTDDKWTPVSSVAAHEMNSERFKSLRTLLEAAENDKVTFTEFCDILSGCNQNEISLVLQDRRTRRQSSGLDSKASSQRRGSDGSSISSFEELNVNNSAQSAKCAETDSSVMTAGSHANDTRGESLDRPTRLSDDRMSRRQSSGLDSKALGARTRRNTKDHDGTAEVNPGLVKTTPDMKGARRHSSGLNARTQMKQAARNVSTMLRVVNIIKESSAEAE